MECRCPHGTFGNPSASGGCVKIKSTRDDALQSPTVAPGPLGLHPNCKTSCGDVRVPYPFGIGPAGCSLPGFNLTCTGYDDPRLLLHSNDGTLEVVNISLADSTVHVIHHARIFSNPTNLKDIESNTYTIVFYDIPQIGEPYTVSAMNEFIFSGCNVQATLYGDYRNSTDSIISSCNSTCSSRSNYILYRDRSAGPLVQMNTNGEYCSGRDDGCCHAPIAAGSSAPKRMEFKLLELQYGLDAVAFISEEGLTNQWGMILNRTDLSIPMTNYMSFSLVLRWAVKQGFTALPGNLSGQCPGDITSSICKSKDSFCRQENEGFTCHCNTGYQGNPYIADGCKDVDECSSNTTKRCFSVCKNLPGTFKCQCPLGTLGNPYKSNGCVSLSTILSTFIKKNKIGLSAASGPVLLLLVLGIMLVPRKIQEHRMKVLKQKYFKQNRGQLLQQLMSQKADITERMIIPMEELAKATNNFDKTRELGGGGHGTVYKGILSDLHVVAIKKSKR
ncbi:hypothetical protein BDA96_03G061300 [Sorghum bicolor]|uniref:EGF-like domain-containing protein n=1 Tax=Sorghum bicolor TaxID=4558 RepID=A0A921ULY4_SORBI|nr:hypothetical protein BDA96_03G061300 [Sorghum bicolor]